jgi:RHS repeat-associated protein
MARRTSRHGLASGPLLSPARLRAVALMTAVTSGLFLGVPDAATASVNVGSGGPAPKMYGYAKGPGQHDGTAAGRAHHVPARATRAHGVRIKGHRAPRPHLAPPLMGRRALVHTGSARRAAGHQITGRPSTLKSATVTDNASYSVAATFDTVPMADQNGRIAVTLTNTGATTWGSGYGLGALIFPSSDPTGTGTPLTTGNPVAISSSVAPGGNATVESVTPAENPGSYTICWDMVNASGTYFSAEGGNEYCAPYTIQQYPPVINEQEPLPGTDVDSQTPTLTVSAVVPGGYPSNPSFSYAFQILNGPGSGATVVASSGWVSGNGNSWAPTANLTWGSTYYWEATVSDAATPPSLKGSGITWTTPISFVVGDAQPQVSSRLGDAYQADDGDPVMTSDLGDTDYSGSGKTVDPRTGNVSLQATDATVATAGPALSVVRTYNSLDPRTSQAFGAGWSSLPDMSLVPDQDGSGALILTLADGQQVRFAKTASGGYAPPQDTYAVVTPLSGGGFSVTDQTGTTYDFAQASGTSWLISGITDNTGMSETFSYSSGVLTTVTNTTSARSLHFTWATPSGASYPHVSTVSTDPVTAGQPGSALTWTYKYSGDLLTSVCPPVSSTQCTIYSYLTNGSHAPTSVLNANPTSYYRLDDAAGATAASNQIPADDLTTMDPPATEFATTLGVTGPVQGTTATSFNGTSSFIPLDGAWCTTPGQESSCTQIADTGRVLNGGGTPESLAISVWFKTTATSGVLFGMASALPGVKPCAQLCENTTQVPLLWIGSNGQLEGLDTLGTSIIENNYVDTSAMSSSSAVNNGAWHQAVLIPGQALYLDGTKVATGTASFTPPAGSYALLGSGLMPSTTGPGVSPPTWTYFNGSMADVSIYQNDLPSVGTVAAQYAAQTHQAAELTSITSPAGRTEFSAAYDTVNDRVQAVTDANGGTWTYSGPVNGASSYAYDSAVMGSSPEDFWPLSDATGPLAHDLVGSAGTSATPRPPATYANVTLGAAGPAGDPDGTAASFNGSSSQVSIPGNYFSGIGAESEELWFKTTSSGTLLSASTPQNGGNPPALWIDTYGCLDAQVLGIKLGDTIPIPGTCIDGFGTGGPQDVAKVNNGKWHQAVLTVSPGVTSSSGAFSQTATLYQDGAEVSSGQITTPPSPASTGYTAYVGNGADGDFSGSIADVSLYTSELTSSQVSDHYASLQNQAAIVDTFPSGVTPPNLNTQTVTVTGPFGKNATYLYSSGALVRMAGALGGVTSYGYDEADRASTITDPDGDTTYIGYDAHNNVTSTTTCAAVNDCQTSYASYYEDLANPLDPRNDKPTAERDARSSSPTDPAYDTVTTYTTTGQMATTSTPPTQACPSGCTTANTYTTGSQPAIGGGDEPAGLLASVTSPSGGVTSYGYDSAGDVMQVTNPLGLITKYTYDNLGRQLTETQISSTYPAGLTTTTAYDGLGRVLTVTDPPVTNRVTGAVHTEVTSYTYDADSNVLTTTTSDATGGDPSRTTTSTYNSHGELATTTDPDGNTVTYTYDALGDLASETDGAGLTTAYTHDANGDLLTTTLEGYTGNPSDPIPAENLVEESRAYDPAGRLASVTNAVGTTTGYTYYGNNQLASSYVVPSGGGQQDVTSYGYDAVGNQTTQTEPGGLVTDAVYNADNQVVSQTQDPGGTDRTVTASYDPNGDVISDTATQSGVSQTVTATYNAMGEELSQTVDNPGGNLTTTYVRDQRGLVTSVTDPDANTTSIENDEAGRPVVEIAPAVPTQTGNGSPPVTANPVTMAGYDTYGDETQFSDADGNVTTATYDADGHQTSVTEPLYTPPGSSSPVNGTSTAKFNSLGQEASTTDPLGHTTTFGYDQLGDLTSQNDPDGGTWTYTYDPAGQQLSVTSPTGAQTQATYDALGQMITTTDLVRQNTSAAYTTSYGYDAAGDETSQTSPAGVTTSAAYNALGEQTSLTDGAGNTTHIAYNLDGNPATVTLPNGTATAVTYDEAGRAVSLSNVSATGSVLRTESAGYDADGNVTSATDFLGHTTTYSYDATGLLTAQTQPVTASQNITVRFGYDLDGNETAYTNGNGNSTYTSYNSLGLPQAITEPSTATYTSPANSTTTDSYDADGNLITQDLPGGVQISNTYDSMGDLTGQSGTGANVPTANRTFSYDTDGQMLTASTSAAGTAGTAGYQPATSESFSYDDRGLLLSASGSAGNSAFTYNGSGQVTSESDAAGTTGYSYDSAGRLATLTDPATGTKLSYGYNDLDEVSQISYGTGGDSRSFGYNNLDELTSDALTTSGGATVASIAYGYDLDGELTSKTTTGFAGAAQNTYSYDEAGRLTSWNNGSTTVGYAYDNDGNLTQAGSHTYTYDARDEQTSATCSGCTPTTMSYTADGDLSTFSGPNGTFTELSDAYGQGVSQLGSSESYDALGRLLTDQGSGGNHTLSYSGASDLIASDGSSTYSYDPAGNLTAIGVAGGSTSQGELAYTDAHTDVVGAFTASASTLSASVAYDPWGNVIATSATAMPGTLGYQSGYSGSGHGLVHMGARWYLPSGGVFTTRDSQDNSPVPDSADANPFGYGGDNPLSQIDPTGHGSSSGGSSSGTITRADVTAAAARAQEAQQTAANAESAASSAWSSAYAAQHAASAAAAYARELNNETKNLLSLYNNVEAQAKQAFAEGAQAQQQADEDIAAANNLKAQLYTEAEPSTGGSGGRSCGVTEMNSGVAEFGALTCESSGGSSGGPGISLDMLRNYFLEQEIETDENNADFEEQVSVADTLRGARLRAVAVSLYTEYFAARAAASVAAGRAQDAASYAVEAFSTARYLSSVAAADEAAAKRAEAEYEAIEEEYEQQQAAAKQAAATKNPPGKGQAPPQQEPGQAPPAVPAAPAPSKPPKKLVKQLANAAIVTVGAVYQTVTQGIESTASNALSCATQPKAGSCLQTAITAASVLLGGEGDLAFDDDAGLALDNGEAGSGGDASLADDSGGPLHSDEADPRWVPVNLQLKWAMNEAGESVIEINEAAEDGLASGQDGGSEISQLTIHPVTPQMGNTTLFGGNDPITCLAMMVGCTMAAIGKIIEIRRGG